MHQYQTKNVNVPDDWLPGVALKYDRTSSNLRKLSMQICRCCATCGNILQSNGRLAAGYHLISQPILRLYGAATCQKASISLETGERCSAEIIFLKVDTHSF